MQNKSNLSLTPWHQVPMVWMIIAIPLSSVLVGMLMLWFAIDSYDGLVVDDYHQQGKEINRTLARNSFAVTHGIGAELRLLPESGILSVRMTFQKPLPLGDTLSLRFVHRTRAGNDIEVKLQKSAEQEYIAPLPQLASSNWIVLIETNEWRIRGQVPIPGNEMIKLDAQ
jgi:hypothetical protein